MNIILCVLWSLTVKLITTIRSNCSNLTGSHHSVHTVRVWNSWTVRGESHWVVWRKQYWGQLSLLCYKEKEERKRVELVKTKLSFWLSAKIWRLLVYAHSSGIPRLLQTSWIYRAWETRRTVLHEGEKLHFLKWNSSNINLTWVFLSCAYRPFVWGKASKRC